jgi:hypothetical protein
MSAEEKQQMYKINVAGEVVHGMKQNTRKTEYTAEFTLPLKGGEALSEIQNKLITPHLKSRSKEFPEFKYVRTCALVSQAPVSGKVEALKAKDIPSMTLEQLNHFAAEKQLNINLSSFASTEEARKALTVHLDNLKLQAQVDKKNATKAAAKKPKAATKDAPKDDEFVD